MFIQTILLVLALLFFPASVYAEEDGSQFLACDMPVLAYTTGESDEIPENLNRGSAEWVIIEVFPIKNEPLSRGFDGWVALIELAADGDESLEDFTEDPEGLAQVKFDGQWMRKYDFERLWCNKKPNIKYFMGGPYRTAHSLYMLPYTYYAKVRCFRKRSWSDSTSVF